jgi:hypothetical protein
LTVNQLETFQRKIDDMRFRGFGGTAIKLHRAIYQIKLNKTNLILSLLLPLLFNFLLLCLLGPILALWRAIFDFWLDKLVPGSSTATQMVDLGHYLLPLTYPNLSAAEPSNTTWWVTLLVCALVLLATFLMPSKRFLPLNYIVRACLLIQATALAYFHWLPGHFPYDAASYLGDALAMSLFFVFMVPWILGLTYYIFSFPLRQKIALTVLALLYFVVAFPMQYLLHAYALHHLSLLFLPLFYLVFGVFLDVMMFVALYSWGMSWRWGGKPD